MEPTFHSLTLKLHHSLLRKEKACSLKSLVSFLTRIVESTSAAAFNVLKSSSRLTLSPFILRLKSPLLKREKSPTCSFQHYTVVKSNFKRHCFFCCEIYRRFHFSFVVKWHINLSGLFNAKLILGIIQISISTQFKCKYGLIVKIISISNYSVYSNISF